MKRVATMLMAIAIMFMMAADCSAIGRGGRGVEAEAAVPEPAEVDEAAGDARWDAAPAADDHRPVLAPACREADHRGRATIEAARRADAHP